MTILSKQNMYHQKNLIILVLLFFTICCNAQKPKIEVNGLTYTILSLESKTVEVSKPNNGMLYSGNIVIPANITFKGRTFDVIGVGDNSFINSKITSLIISEGITYLGNSAFENSKMLRTVSLPKSLKIIKLDCFCFCI